MRRSFPLFLLLALSILGFCYAYLGWRLADSAIAWALLAIPFVTVAIYPFVIWLLPRHRLSSARNFIQWMSYLGMAGLSFLLPLVLIRDLITMPVLIWGAPETTRTVLKLFTPSANLVLVVVAGLLLAQGLRQALTGLRLLHIDIELDQLPAALEGTTIAQISDLHVGPTIGHSYVENVVALTNSAKADLVVLTGDIVDGPVESLRDEVAPLARLEAKRGVFYVTGNHEYYWQGPHWVEELRRLGLKPLLNSNAIVEVNGEKVLVGGVVDPAAALSSPGLKPDVQSAVHSSEATALKILLAHHPNIADKAEKAGFDLQLSGHTHGGQFFPWTLVVQRVHRYHLGLFTHGRMKVYVNPGTGSWGPPVRLGTSPEITVIRLKRRA